MICRLMLSRYGTLSPLLLMASHPSRHIKVIWRVKALLTGGLVVLHVKDRLLNCCSKTPPRVPMIQKQIINSDNVFVLSKIADDAHFMDPAHKIMMSITVLQNV